jgi:hypothetical protein
MPRWNLAVVVIVAFAGCDATPPKAEPVPVSGTVTLDGKPLPEGVVYFKIVQSGVLERFEIANGVFTGTAPPGEYRVEISATHAAKAVIDGHTTTVQESYIPARYNRESQLKATVAAEGPNQFKFELALK